MDSVIIMANDREPVQTSMRACEECKRKKTKCDMRRPNCSGCSRCGSTCVFPTSRKRPVRRKKNVDSSPKKDHNAKLNRLLQILEDGDDDAVRNLLSITHQRREAFALSCVTSPAEASPSNSTTREQPITNMISSENLIRRSLSTTNIMLPETEIQLHDGFDITFTDPWYRDGEQTGMENGGMSFQDFTFEGMDLEIGAHGSAPASMPDIHQRTRNSSTQQSPVNRLERLLTPICEGEERMFSLSVSASTADRLIETYFEKIQGFLPLFHRPSFYSQYLERDGTAEKYTRLSLETALLLNSMFALSARFCDISELSGTDPKQRGNPFADQARSLYERARRGRGADQPTFEYLQGCLTYTYYLFTSSPCTFSWVMVGVCCRLAYDMGLHEIDQKLIYDDARKQDPEGWVEREGIRRLWWSLWELDSFASTISCRPCNIDQNRVYVLLPVSDEAWFSNNMIHSVPLGADLTAAWQSLEESENQDERAWFIVSNALMRYAHEAVQSRSTSLRSVKELQNAVTCFELLLPTSFHLGSGYLSFNKNTFARNHWIIGTTLTLEEAKIHAELLDARYSPRERSSPSTNVTSDITIETLEKRRQHLENVARVVRALSPEYLPLASPFFSCMLIGVSGTNIYKTPYPPSAEDFCTSSITQMLILALKHFARYWNIGTLLLALVDLLQKPEPSTVTRKEQELKTQFVYLTPKSLCK